MSEYLYVVGFLEDIAGAPLPGDGITARALGGTYIDIDADHSGVVSARATADGEVRLRLHRKPGVVYELTSPGRMVPRFVSCSDHPSGATLYLHDLPAIPPGGTEVVPTVTVVELSARIDALVVGAVEDYLTAHPTALNGAVDTHLGGDATNLVPTVNGKVAKGELVVNVKDYGAAGDGVADDTAAAQSALTAAAGRILHLPAGSTFLVDTLNISTGTRITGGGTLKFKPSTTAFALLAATDVSDITIDGITLDGNLTGNTFSEFRHAVQIVGGSNNITIRGCTFRDLIGDGVYIYRGASGNIPQGVNITGNHFTGANANRNGVSLISGKGIRIVGNHFDRMSRDDMPGAIDIEPNNAADEVRNVVIANNTIVGGTATPGQQKAVAVNNGHGSPCTNIAVADNTIRGAFRYGIAVFGNDVNQALTAVSVRGNAINVTASVVSSAAIVLSAKVECSVTNNTIDGGSVVEAGVRSIGSTFTIVGNKIKQCAQFGVELLSPTVEVGTISGNLIEDCGNNGAAIFGGIHIKGSYITITDNRIIGVDVTKTQCGLYIESGTKNLVAGNFFRGCNVRSINSPAAPQVWGQNIYDKAFNSIGGTYPPATESWIGGDVIFNPNPAAGAPIGWTCITAGTPGTWKPFGTVLAAVATGSRPTPAAATAGGSVFDTTLNKPIWSDGTNWRDATGAVV